jgi:transglutaminase-like putative cysteine protease
MVTSFIHSYGPGAVKTLDFNLALPEERPSQKFLSPPKLDPEPSEIVSDQYGQKVARYVVKDLAAGGEKKVSYTLDAALWAIRWFIYPDSVGTLAEIPSEVKGRYLFDGKKYDITHPYIREIIKRVAGDEKNPYWIARKLYDYLIQHMEYKLEGGWNSAPEALKRGTGSCSEYTFCYIALCRAAGIPARYVGSVVMRGDEASLDDVFHRWCEIYLPSYGWIPVDPDAGDEPLPADRARAFGGTKNHYLITTSGGGDSLFLKWSYNLVELWSFEGKCRLYIENIAEWEPLK